MKTKNRRSSLGFTLLELVIVLAILAVLTTLATREVGYLEDQRRFETTQSDIQDIQNAVVGSPADRAADGTRIISGFVADMGRLPRTAGTTELTLQELWVNPNPGVLFDVRPATQANGVLAADEDAQVLVPGGWHGPYIRLPIGCNNLLDGWGNPFVSPITGSPQDPLGTGYARLRDASDNAITAVGQEIRIIRHLGANGRLDAADTSYNRDGAIIFTDDLFCSALKGHVEVLNGSSPAVPDVADTVIIRVFGPDPANAGKIKVTSVSLVFATNPLTWEVPQSSGLTIGPRVVRAYFNDSNTNGTSFYRQSAIKSVIVSPGANMLDLVIDR